jgi:hypothetical protein
MHQEENSQFQNSNTSNIMNIDYDIINNSSFQTHRLKLDEVIEAIKKINKSYNIIEELRIAIKILKRFKLTESCKWYNYYFKYVGIQSYL